MAVAEFIRPQDLEDDKLPISLPNTCRIVSTLETDTQNLFLRFLQTPQAKHLLEITVDLLHAHENGEIENFQRHLAGRIFEELTAIYLQQQSGSKYTFLTSEDIVRLYGYIDPQTKIIDHMGVLHEIVGAVFPDIVKLRNATHTWQVTEIYECKLQTSIDFNSSQMQSYQWPRGLERLLRLDNSRLETTSERLEQNFHMAFPRLERKPVKVHPSPKFKFAVPSNTVIEGLHPYVIIPLDTRSFGWTINAIIDDCSSTP